MCQGLGPKNDKNYEIDGTVGRCTMEFLAQDLGPWEIQLQWGADYQTTLFAFGLFLILAFPLERSGGNFRIHEIHGDLMSGKRGE